MNRFNQFKEFLNEFLNWAVKTYLDNNLGETFQEKQLEFGLEQGMTHLDQALERRGVDLFKIRLVVEEFLLEE